MNNLMIKEVNFHDDKLLAIRDDNLDKIYVGASYVCNGIGLSRKKADYEIERIKTDMVLKKRYPKNWGTFKWRITRKYLYRIRLSPIMVG